jgi:hypothetical protein
MERPTKKRLDAIRASMAGEAWFDVTDFAEVFAEIDALTFERDLYASNLMRSNHRACRRGFEAAQAWNFEEDRPKYPTWEHYEKQLAEAEEDVAREIRIAEAEDGEK